MMYYIFEKEMVKGPQKQCSQISDIQKHKYKYTNTQIQYGSNLQINLTCAIFLKRQWYEDLKNNVPEFRTCNSTNTQMPTRSKAATQSRSRRIELGKKLDQRPAARARASQQASSRTILHSTRRSPLWQSRRSNSTRRSTISSCRSPC